jgi:hypothetical protein
MILSTMAKSMRCILPLWFRQKRSKPNSRVRSFIYPYLFCNLPPFPVSKKPRETYKPWVPDANETSALETAEVIPCQGDNYLGEISHFSSTYVSYSSPRTAESWSDLLSKCGTSMFCTQPFASQLLPQRQTQLQAVQGGGGLHVLRDGQTFHGGTLIFIYFKIISPC